MKNAGLLLVQNCLDHPPIRSTQSPLYCSVCFMKEIKVVKEHQKERVRGEKKGLSK